MAPIVGYWNFLGKAEPIRLLLAYVGVDFTDQAYSRGEDGKGAEWFDKKLTLGFDFPNLPYLIDGNVKLTQTVAIMRYLGRKHNLAGSTEQERIRIDLIEQQLNDVFDGYRLYKFKLAPVDEVEYLTKLDAQLGELSKFLGTQKYAAGDNISYIDFWFAVFLAFLLPNKQVEKLLEKYANLTQFGQRIKDLPKVSAFLQKQKQSLI